MPGQLWGRLRCRWSGVVRMLAIALLLSFSSLLSLSWSDVAMAEVGVPIDAATGTDDHIGITPSLVVHFFDAGQGDAVLFEGEDFTILIDAGRHDRSDVVGYLERAGVEAIDLFIGTHPHADHIGQCAPVIRRFPVREVWLSGDVHTTLTFSVH